MVEAADEVLTGDRVITQGRVRVWVAVVGQLRASLPSSTLSPLSTNSHNPHTLHIQVFYTLAFLTNRSNKKRTGGFFNSYVIDGIYIF